VTVEISALLENGRLAKVAEELKKSVMRTSRWICRATGVAA
jgi:hypothetical protein